VYVANLNLYTANDILTTIARLPPLNRIPPGSLCFVDPTDRAQQVGGNLHHSEHATYLCLSARATQSHLDLETEMSVSDPAPPYEAEGPCTHSYC
jgi:hypothetical protein